MKKLIITVVIFLIPITYSYSQSLKSTSKSEVRDRTIDSLYTNISAGAGIYTLDFKDDTGFGFNIGVRHQFSQKFYLEGNFCFVGKMKSSNSEMYIFSIIPQWNVYEDGSLKFIIGTGLEIWSAEGGGMILPLGVAKLGYNISKEFFIYPEIKALPFSASINFGLRFP